MYNHASYSRPIVKLIMTTKLTTLKSILRVILQNLKQNETLEFTFWRDQIWYVEVIDNNIRKKVMGTQQSPQSTRFALSLNTYEDRVEWNHLGGNCWVRGKRWLQFWEANFKVNAIDNEHEVEHGRRVPALDRKHAHIYRD